MVIDQYIYPRNIMLSTSNFNFSSLFNTSNISRKFLYVIFFSSQEVRNGEKKRVIIIQCLMSKYILRNYIIISPSLLVGKNEKVILKKKKVTYTSCKIFALVNYPTDTFHSEPSIVVNAKLPTLCPSYRSVHAGISRMTCHPCLIRRTFLTCFS